MQDELATPVARFPLGHTTMTSGAHAELTEQEILAAIRRHCRGDWGELDPPDKARNDQALRTEGRLVSRYRSAGGVIFYIITECDRTATTVLLPHEY